jgi:hypothetical protein
MNLADKISSIQREMGYFSLCLSVETLINVVIALILLIFLYKKNFLLY